MYYANKINTIKEIFNDENIILKTNSLVIGGKEYPVIDDVIILLEKSQYTDFIRSRLKVKIKKEQDIDGFSHNVQYSFSEEWKQYNEILPEHKEEFCQYFDIIKLDNFKNKRVCDLGCGNGRWSYFLKDSCRELILVDFSDAIFTARRNLLDSDNVLYFMCDLKKLPFKNDFADFIFSLGVLHHLPTPCLDEVKRLKKYAPELLVFLYYALDNRPPYFQIILKIITIIRKYLSNIKSTVSREFFSLLGAYLIYLPLIYIGRLLKPLKLSSYIPLFDFYKNKSIKRIQQDVYDRFFTSIEQRVSRKEIFKLRDTFSKVMVSDNLPYWHFLCQR